ncbi:MAG: alpha-glucuronidase [Lachnospiraceae bacterium]|nr:alpha-glucuronidase [Lachnospiraceae bacterium]
MGFEKAWLNYSRKDCKFPQEYSTLSVAIDNGKDVTDIANNVGLTSDLEMVIIRNAVKEINEAFIGFYGESFKETEYSDNTDIVLRLIKCKDSKELNDDAYSISEKKGQLVLSARKAENLLQAAFEFIRLIARECEISGRKVYEPSNPLRMLNHWDNFDGSIERGYSGNSFFFIDGAVLVDARTELYARLCASVGINAAAINNVNVHKKESYLITDKHLDRIVKLQKILASYGIKLFLSINYAAPIEIGGLDNCDPLDENVSKFWEERIAEIYKLMPEFGGFLVKADSEGRPGPFTYGRDHAEGANLFARILKEYGGILIWRCFVYNCKQDWRDMVTDRARACYDNFVGLDGKFLSNVYLQIKNGPMDFQIREPINPLFGAMSGTNQILEVQAAQEYTGQQRHICYLIPMWKEALEFKTYCLDNEELALAAYDEAKGSEPLDKVKDIVAGRTYRFSKGGMVSVSNTGDDDNWTGHDFAALNFYGFGRLAFNTELTAEEIAREWISLEFGNDPLVMEVILKIVLDSREVYEKYTSPYGIGWMVNPSHHYGPNVDGYEYDRWGTYHKANHKTVGLDRTSKGTGYATQYFKQNALMYENIDTCPENLLLFFHKVPYNRVMSNGKTLIQNIYDMHFEGAYAVARKYELFKTLEGHIPEHIFKRCCERMEHQVAHSAEWRDVVNTYFHRLTDIDDEQGRKIYE